MSTPRAVFVLLALAALAPAQPPAPTSVPPNPESDLPVARPQLVAVHENEPTDRGRHQIGSTVTRRITLENVSDGHVVLRVIGTSCPCTVANIDRASLAPRETAVVTLATRAAEVSGPAYYTAEIEAAPAQADDGVAPQRISVGIRYTPDVGGVVHPHMATMIAIEGESTTLNLVVRRLDGVPPALDMRTPGDWVRVKAVKPWPDVPWVTIVTLESNARSVGLHRGRLGLRFDGEAIDSVHAEIALRVVPPLVASPPGLVCRETAEGWEGQGASIRLTPATLALRPRIPASATLRTPCAAISVGEFERVRDGTEWTLPIRLDPAELDDRASHGSREVAVMDAEGTVLCVIPVIWFTRAALTAPSGTAGEAASPRAGGSDPSQ